MKKYLLLIIYAIVTLSTCKKDNNPSIPDKDIVAVYALTSTASDTRAKFLELAPQTGGDPKLALMQTLEWVKQQGTVKSAFQVDSIYLFFEMNSGLRSLFWFNELNQDGSSRYRGGSGGSGQLKNMVSGGDCQNVVENKAVLIYAPGYSEFNYGISPVPARLEGSDKLGEVIISKDEQATHSVISTFPNYGLVLIETHGTPYSFMTGHKVNFGESEIPGDINVFKETILNQVGQEVFDQILSGKLMICNSVSGFPQGLDWWADQEDYKEGRYSIHATVKYIQEIASLSGTIVVGSFCYSGWTTPIADELPYGIGQAFKDKNPISYYGHQRPNGYSRIVDSQYCLNVEDSLTRRLVLENDSTGIAHLKADNTQFADVPFRADLFFVNLGQPNWCYEGCGADLVDTRSGTQVYKTVCIGDQTWMAENLNYSGGGEGVCYDNSPTNCSNFGRLYSWQEVTGGTPYTTGTPVQGICPQGWHVPSEAEVQELIDYCGGPAAAATKLRTTSGWPTPNQNTDGLGFSLKPAGYYVTDGTNGYYSSVDTGGYFWTSTEVYANSDYRALKAFHPDLSLGTFASFSGLTYKFSCRCVKDE